VYIVTTNPVLNSVFGRGFFMRRVLITNPTIKACVQSTYQGTFHVGVIIFIETYSTHIRAFPSDKWHHTGVKVDITIVYVLWFLMQ
jgi:hypothetical protein